MCIRDSNQAVRPSLLLAPPEVYVSSMFPCGRGRGSGGLAALHRLRRSTNMYAVDQRSYVCQARLLNLQLRLADREDRVVASSACVYTMKQRINIRVRDKKGTPPADLLTCGPAQGSESVVVGGGGRATRCWRTAGRLWNERRSMVDVRNV
eukprot:TRINITY_DN13911_c0_g1_i1.p1 TRINITY_DN13911_c0_g1~~TRINITY_DN13911_c0_g1_i1.p1  ORF type:complete len:151 (+),score=12.85 TRINITY_DN13911_c0_g1_i1:126-578(+)